MGFAGQGYIDSAEMAARIEELTSMRSTLVWKVYRVRNDEVLRMVNSIRDAMDFIDAGDFDPAKVKFSLISAGLSDEDAEELGELEAEYQEGLDSFSSWGEGITVKMSNDISSYEYARDYLNDNYYGNRLLNLVRDYIDLDSLGDALLDEVEGGDIGGFYYIDV